jgi:MFS family permease
MFTARSSLPAWQWNQYVITFAVFVVFLGFSFVNPFLPLYLHRELGIADLREVAWWNGIIFGISPLLGAFSGPLWGKLADRFGYKRMTQRALFTIIFVLGGMAFATTVWHLFALRVLLGLMGGIMAMSMALITSISPPAETSQAVGLVQGARALSQAVAPLFGGIIADTFGMRQSFIASGGMAFAAFMLLTLIYREAPEARKPAQSKTKPSLLSLLRAPTFFAVFVVIFMVQVIDQSFNPVMPLFVAMLEGGTEKAATWSGFIISSAAIAITFSAMLVGRMATRHSARRLLYATLLLGMVVCIPLALSGSTLELWAWRTVLGLLAGGTVTLAFSVGGKVIPDEIRGSGFGLLTSAQLIGNAVSPILFGVLAGVSLRGAFGLNAVIYGVVFVWVWFVLRQASRAPLPVDAPSTTQQTSQARLRENL